MADAVRDAGAVVALAGLGGDEPFAGCSTFRHVPRLVGAGRALEPLGALPRALARAMGWSSRTARWRGRRAVDAVGRGGWADAYAAVRGLFSVAELLALWPAGGDHVGECMVHINEDHAPVGVAGVGWLEMANYLLFQLLRDTDCMSMAHALEVRVPLLDDDVVDLAVQGLCSGERCDKARLIAAADPALAFLAQRPKRTFTLPIDRWMRGRLRGVAEEALVGLGEANLGFDRRVLTGVWHGYLGGRVGWRPVWALAVLGRWLGVRAGSAPLMLASPS